MGVINTGAVGDVYHNLGGHEVGELLKLFGSAGVEFLRSVSPRGANFSIKTAETESAALSGGTSNVGTTLIPAGALVLGVTTRVTTLITAVTGVSFSIGDGSTADRWGAGIAFALGTTTTSADFKTGTTLLQVYKTATNVVLTPNAGTFSAGKVRATVFYASFSAPTS